MVKKEEAAKVSVLAGAVIGISAYITMKVVTDPLVVAMIVGLATAVYGYAGMVRSKR